MRSIIYSIDLIQIVLFVKTLVLLQCRRRRILKTTFKNYLVECSSSENLHRGQTEGLGHLISGSFILDTWHLVLVLLTLVGFGDKDGCDDTESSKYTSEQEKHVRNVLQNFRISEVFVAFALINRIDHWDLGGRIGFY